MQVQIADVGPHRKQLTISFDAGEVASRTGALLTQFGRNAKLDGFRPGKVSRSLLEKRFGGAARAQAEDEMTQEGFGKAIEEHQLKPVGALSNDNVDRAAGFAVTVSFETRPPIVFPAASAITGVDVTRNVVGDAQLDEAMQSMAKRAGETTALTADETVQADDALVISGAISANGSELRKLHDFHHLVGAYPLFGKPPADVIAILAGKKVGDTFALSTTLPASFTPAEAANTQADLSATIQSAQRLRAAVLDDEFAVKVGAKDLADLSARLKERMSATKDNEQRQKQLAQLSEALLAQIAVELPPELLRVSTERAMSEAAANKKGDDLVKAQLTAQENTAKELKKFLIIEALAEHLNIQVSQQDIADQIQMAAWQTGRKADAIAQQLRTSGKANQVMVEIRQAKALESMLDQVIAAHLPAAAAAQG